MTGIVTKGDWQKDLIALGPTTFLGLTLFISGMGKMLEQTIPGQTEFADLLLKSFYTPAMAKFIAYVLPPGEIVLGLFLVFGIFPRISAALCIPLNIGFMANNILAISRGMEAFSSCGCFGVWEKLLGSVTPAQALVYDVVMLALAVIVVRFHPTGWRHFRPWLIKKWKWEGTK